MREQVAQQTVRQTDDYELADDEAMYTKRPPSSARVINKPVHLNQRPQPPTPFVQRKSAVQPGQPYIPPGSYVQGNTRFNVHQGAPPPTGKKQQRRPQANVNTANPPGVIYGQPYRDTDAPAIPTQGRLRRTFTAHPLLYLGIGMVIALLLWVVGSWAVSSWNGTWDYIHYNYPRTYQINAVIGQGGDSPGNPTHIIFLNNNRRVQVIVIPPDTSKSQLYTVTTLVEAGSEFYPITGYVKDVTGNGKPDIVVIIQNDKTVLLNTGTGFKQMQPGQSIPNP